MGIFVESNEELLGVGTMWGRMVLYVTLACATLHFLCGVILTWRLILKGCGAVFIPLLYFILGGLYSFILTAPTVWGIVLCHYTLNFGLTEIEMIIYGFVLTIVVIFFTSGKTSILYCL
eukprot:Tbor_TRINITY_DN5111_c0_g1::TRINITY_DN5111_c0_g1_i1::g.26068::m.26068